MLAQNFESFEQWKAMIVLVSSCRNAIDDSSFEELWFCLIPTIYAQLKELPKDFFFENLSENNFITDCMSQFIWNCEESSSLAMRVKKRVEKLKKMLVDDYKFIPFQSDE
jgi:A1 cistron-splicing factor AAR2